MTSTLKENIVKKPAQPAKLCKGLCEVPKPCYSVRRPVPQHWGVHRLE